MMELTIYTAFPKIDDEHTNNELYFCVASLNVKSIKNSILPNTHIIFTIDTSASMDEPMTRPFGTTKLQKVITTIRGCLHYIQTNGQTAFITIITFSNKAKEILSYYPSSELGNLDFEELEKSIRDTVDYQTNVQCALEMASDIIATVENNGNQHSNTSHLNIVLTDGYINIGADTSKELATIIVNTRENLKMKQNTYTCSFIGVGEDHDYLLLRDIANKTDGTNNFLESTNNADILYADLLSPYFKNYISNVTFSGVNQGDILFFNPQTGETNSSEFRIPRITDNETRYIHMLSRNPCCSDLRVNYDVLTQTNIRDTKTIPIHNVIYEGEEGHTVKVFTMRMKTLDLLTQASRLLESENESQNTLDDDAVATPPALVRTDVSMNRLLAQLCKVSDPFERIKQSITSLISEITSFKTQSKLNLSVFHNGLCDMLIKDLEFGDLALARADIPDIACMFADSRLSSQMWQKAYSIQSTVRLLQDMERLNNGSNINSPSSVSSSSNHQLERLVTQEQIYNIYASSGTLDVFNTISSSVMYNA